MDDPAGVFQRARLDSMLQRIFSGALATLAQLAVMALWAQKHMAHKAELKMPMNFGVFRVRFVNGITDHCMEPVYAPLILPRIL